MPRKPAHPSIVGQVTVTQDGVSYSGEYVVSPGKHPLITVNSDFGSRSTQLGGLSAESLARLLLSEIVLARPR